MEVEEVREEIQLDEISGEPEEEQREEQTSQELMEEQQFIFEEPEEEPKQEIEQEKKTETKEQEDKGGFIHGLAVGLGLGCISTFIILWITVFFAPQLPSTLTYESLLSIFIYPMLYLLIVGLVAITAGIVREYYIKK